MMKNKGFSLIEILVVISIFAFLGILVTRSVILTIAGSKKSESTVKVRENLDYTLQVIDRQLRNASSIVECPNPDPKEIDYIDQNGNQTLFRCAKDVNGIGLVASGSAQMTSSEVNIKTCSFSCTQDSTTLPAVVTVFLEGVDVTTGGAQAADVTLSSQISLRNY